MSTPDAGWGPPPVIRRTPAELERRRLLEEQHLAEHAQQMRAEAIALGYTEETQRYFGLGEHAGAGIEQLLTRHGTAGVYRTCTSGEHGRRCDACRAYQAERVARGRRARAGMCARNRSSYDAGCRCVDCSAKNADAARRWRQARRARLLERIAA